MVDLQRVFVDDDALDDELQDGLALAEVGILEPRADPLAERGHVRQHRLDANALFGQVAVLVALLRGGLVLLGDRPAPLGQLLEADHLGLVGLEQPPAGPRQAVEPGLQLPPDRLLLGLPSAASAVNRSNWATSCRGSPSRPTTWSHTARSITSASIIARGHLVSRPVVSASTPAQR